MKLSCRWTEYKQNLISYNPLIISLACLQAWSFSDQIAPDVLVMSQKDLQSHVCLSDERYVPTGEVWSDIDKVMHLICICLPNGSLSFPLNNIHHPASPTYFGIEAKSLYAAAISTPPSSISAMIWPPQTAQVLQGRVSDNKVSIQDMRRWAVFLPLIKRVMIWWSTSSLIDSFDCRGRNFKLVPIMVGALRRSR